MEWLFIVVAAGLLLGAIAIIASKEPDIVHDEHGNVAKDVTCAHCNKSFNADRFGTNTGVQFDYVDGKYFCSDASSPLRGCWAIHSKRKTELAQQYAFIFGVPLTGKEYTPTEQVKELEETMLGAIRGRFSISFEFEFDYATKCLSLYDVDKELLLTDYGQFYLRPMDSRVFITDNQLGTKFIFSSEERLHFGQVPVRILSCPEGMALTRMDADYIIRNIIPKVKAKAH